MLVELGDRVSDGVWDWLPVAVAEGVALSDGVIVTDPDCVPLYVCVILGD